MSETPSSYGTRLLRGVLVAFLGVAVHMTALAVADRTASSFPSVSDVFIDRLPVINLFLIGELCFLILAVAFAAVYLKHQRSDLPFLFMQIGIFYGVRGLFLLFLPIGAPNGAMPVDDRFAFWPYAGHAYFPGGHVGILFLLSRGVRNATARRLFIVATLLFGFGTLLTKAHYTADLLGGLLLAYAVSVWAERNLRTTTSPLPNMKA